MHTLEIPEINYKAQYPSCLSEMNRWQYLKFIQLYLLLEADKITWQEFRIRLLSYFITIVRTTEILTPEEIELIHGEIFRISETLDSFCITKTEQNKEHLELDLSNTRNLLPKVGKLHGPADALTDLSFFEYIEAHHAFLACSADATGSIPVENIDRLIAILYRPKRRFLFFKKLSPLWNGQSREKYNEHTVEGRMLKVSRLPLEVKIGILIWYRACEEFLQTGVIGIGLSQIDFSLLYQETDKAEQNDTGLIGVLYTLAESGVFGSVKQTAESNLYDVIVRIYQLLRTLKTTE